MLPEHLVVDLKGVEVVVDLLSGIEQGLLVSQSGYLLLSLGHAQIGCELTLIENRLGELGQGVDDQSAGIGHGLSECSRPSGTARKGELGIEGRAGLVGGIIRTGQGHLRLIDVGTVGEQFQRHSHREILRKSLLVDGTPFYPGIY